MKIKLGQLVNSFGTTEKPGGLSKLMELKLPVKISYKLSRLVFNVQPDLNIYEAKRTELVKEYGEPAPDLGEGQVRVKKDSIPKFMEEITKLQDIEVDLKLGEGKEFEKIKISDLGEVNIEPNELSSLNWLLEE